MKYKAIFFDRDNTLTYFTKEKESWRDRIISEWSGKPFDLSYEKMMKLFELAGEGRSPWYKTLDDEREFFKRYYKYLLIGEGVKEDIVARSELLFNELWCNGDRVLFPETVEVLEYFSSHGYKMGVISDTSPSLEYTLQQLGIAKYFTSFTASSLVGAGKPSPIIFNAALNAQGVIARESIYVDDYKPEADGAREQGFTSFLIDRSGKNTDKWTIHSLNELIDFAEREMNKSNISLHIPSFEELRYRQKLLSDADTMSYNKVYDLNFDGYDNETGCIDFPKEDWQDWYDYFIGREPERYYAYIVAGGEFIGEVNVHENKEMNWYDMGIVIEAKHRGKGYAVTALKLLLEQAFDQLGAKAVHNDFEDIRNAAVKTHLAAGFREYKRENGIFELLITKEQYASDRRA